MQDRYAEGRFLPAVDCSQDWTLEHGEQENGYTILEFSRTFVTCDPKDLDIKVRKIIQYKPEAVEAGGGALGLKPTPPQYLRPQMANMSQAYEASTSGCGASKFRGGYSMSVN